MKYVFSRLLRLLVQVLPWPFKKLAIRIPFSRFSHLFSKMLWSEEEVFWQGVNLRVNPGEKNGFYVYIIKEYENEIIEKLTEVSRQANIFLDVGANIGLICLPVANVCRDLEVFAFEPERLNLDKLRYNIGLNKDLINRITVIDKAAYNRNGPLTFEGLTPESCNNGVAHIELSLTDKKGCYAVEGVRLDGFFDRIGKYPDVVKIDVEGAEFEVIEGMQGILEKGFVNSMVIEVHAGFLTKDADSDKLRIIKLLKKNDFELFWLKEKKWEPVPAPSLLPKQFILFVSRVNKQNSLKP